MEAKLPLFIMKAKKSLGQNFLINQNVINKIGASINANTDDLIIEIGPGRGALTKELQKKNCKLICYEVDLDMHIFLEKLENNNTKVIYKDILNANINEDIKNIQYNNLYIVGNLPYYITTPIIKKIIALDLDIKEMIFMVQEEVADRFTSFPNSKNYGSITLYLKYYFDVTKLFSVSKNSFSPIPKVESAIIKFTKRAQLLDVEKDKYFNLINDSFRMKRKTLKNNLSNYNFDIIKEVLNKYDLPETVRAEELSEEVFVSIVNKL